MGLEIYARKFLKLLEFTMYTLSMPEKAIGLVVTAVLTDKISGAKSSARGLPILRLRGLSLSNWRLFLQQKASLIIETFVNTIVVSMLLTQ